jgi:membrane associated rhomboid family serine protease
MLMTHSTSTYFENHANTKPPRMIYFLMGLNMLFYALHALNLRQPTKKTFLSALSGAATLENMILVPDQFYQEPRKKWPTIIGTMFTHANFVHLAFNMAALYKFGRPLEHAFGRSGPLDVFLIYMTSGILANLIYVLRNRDSKVGIVGASAAISGIGAAYFLEYADRENMRAWLIFQIVGALLAKESGISFGSHLIGFGVGAIVYLILRRGHVRAV